MKQYIFTEQEINSILTRLQEVPAKFVFDVIYLLKSKQPIPPEVSAVSEKKKEDKKSGNN